MAAGGPRARKTPLCSLLNMRQMISFYKTQARGGPRSIKHRPVDRRICTDVDGEANCERSRDALTNGEKQSQLEPDYLISPSMIWLPIAPPAAEWSNPSDAGGESGSRKGAASTLYGARVHRQRHTSRATLPQRLNV
jgi:hypothetical protein